MEGMARSSRNYPEVAEEIFEAAILLTSQQEVAPLKPAFEHNLWIVLTPKLAGDDRSGLFVMFQRVSNPNALAQTIPGVVEYLAAMIVRYPERPYPNLAP